MVSCERATTRGTRSQLPSQHRTVAKGSGWSSSRQRPGRQRGRAAVRRLPSGTGLASTPALLRERHCSHLHRSRQGGARCGVVFGQAACCSAACCIIAKSRSFVNTQLDRGGMGVRQGRS